ESPCEYESRPCATLVTAAAESRSAQPRAPTRNMHGCQCFTRNRNGWSIMLGSMKRPRSRIPGARVGLLTVSETARILGVSPSTLRLWESVGLITPARSNGRYRLYSPELLELLKRIKYL